MEGDDDHGYEGPIQISYGGTRSRVADDFSAAALSHYGIEPILDLQNFHAVDRTTKLTKYINPDTGKRADAAHGYIQTILNSQQNLQVLLQSKVRRVLFENQKAIGVEYVAK